MKKVIAIIKDNYGSCEPKLFNCFNDLRRYFSNNELNACVNLVSFRDFDTEDEEAIYIIQNMFNKWCDANKTDMFITPTKQFKFYENDNYMYYGGNTYAVIKFGFDFDSNKRFLADSFFSAIKMTILYIGDEYRIYLDKEFWG